MYREDLPASVITCGRPTSLEPVRPGPSGEGVFIKVAWGRSTTCDETCGTHFGQRIYCDLYSKDPSWNEANKEFKELLTSYMFGGSLRLPLVAVLLQVCCRVSCVWVLGLSCHGERAA